MTSLNRNFACESQKVTVQERPTHHHERVILSSSEYTMSDLVRWSVVIVAIVIAVLCIAGYVFAPKGDNQTYLVHLVQRTNSKCLAILDYTDARIMLFTVGFPADVTDGRWAITYLAQLHPLIEPRSSKLRPDIVHGDSF